MRFFNILLAILFLFLPLYLLSLYRPELPALLKDNMGWLPYAILLTGLFLCVVFYDSREFCLLLVTGLCYWVFQSFIWSKGLPDIEKEYLFNLLSFLFPLNLLFYYLLNERGLLNLYGIKRIGLLVVESLFVAWLVSSNWFLLFNFLNYEIVKTTLTEQTAMQQPVIILWLAVFLVVLIYWLMQGGFLRAIWMLACIALFIAMYSFFNVLFATLYISIAGLIISVGIIINAYNLAYRDELTHLPSRRALKQQLMALGKTYSIAMVDVDHFKKLNDTYGHDVGDDVLKLLASQLNSVEGGGKAFRYGGEEFTVVFSGKDAEHAAEHLEELRTRIASTPFVIRHKKRPRKKPEITRQPDETKELNITVSIGVAEKQDEHDNPQEVIKSADNALYKAKQKGRNQVVICDS